MTMLDPSFLRMPVQRDVPADGSARGEAHGRQAHGRQDGDAFRALLEKVQGVGRRGEAAGEERRAEAAPPRSLRALVERLGEVVGAGEETADASAPADGEWADVLPEGAEARADGAAEAAGRQPRVNADGVNLPVSEPPAAKQADAEADVAETTQQAVDEEGTAAQRLAGTKQGFGVDTAPRVRPLPKLTVVGRETHFEPVGVVKPQAGAGEAAEEPLPQVKGRVESSPPAGLREARRQGGQPAEKAAALRAVKVEAEAAGSTGPQAEGLPAQTLQQLGERLAGEARGLASSRTQPAGHAAEMQAQPGQQQAGGPVRVLHIQLHPAELGSVSVRMRLVGDGIEVHMRASDARTVQMLQNDSEALTGVLRAAGYRPEVVTLQIGSADAGGGQTLQGGGQQSAAGQQAFQGETSGGGRGASPSQAQEHARRSRREGEGDGHTGLASGRDSSGIYL